MTSFRPQISIALALLFALIAQTAPAYCASAKSAAPEKQPAPAAPAPSEDSAPSYEPRLLRLAEILGALTYLQDLCKMPGTQTTGQVWRNQMTALIEAEGTTQSRKEHLAGAYNRGFRSYELNYRQCTPNAQAIIARFLDESGKLAHEIAQHNGA